MEDRFMKFVEKTDECWLWTGYTTANGYGQFRADGRVSYAHRVAYALWVEEVPEGSVVHHICAVRNCVNPAHLQAVTPQENVAEMVERTYYKDRIAELEDTIAALEIELARYREMEEGCGP